jgi:hypothetical protein
MTEPEPNDFKAARVEIRLTPTEAQTFRLCANAQGLSLSKLIRALLHEHVAQPPIAKLMREVKSARAKALK